MKEKQIPFNKPFMTGRELSNIREAQSSGHLSGDGYFTAQCNQWIQDSLGCGQALLTHSCTAALEMAALLANISHGDEIIMPSYTFVSTANAFVLRGGMPVFVDIRKDTLNINEELIEAAITERTKAIVAVHYAGISCEMDAILDIAKKYGLLVIEDAAQGFLSKYKGKYLGTIGDIGCLSFHETKNIISGEGGALLVNNPRFRDRASIIREKGTNRRMFQIGSVDKYSWVDLGSSFLPSELIAAFLWGQLNESAQIIQKRMDIWNTYDDAFDQITSQGEITVPCIPSNCIQNAHMYYIILGAGIDRSQFISRMSSKSIQCVFHYSPLHSSPFYRKYSNQSIQELPVTERVSEALVRLPLWIGVDASRVASTVLHSVSNLRRDQVQS